MGGLGPWGTGYPCDPHPILLEGQVEGALGKAAALVFPALLTFPCLRNPWRPVSIQHFPTRSCWGPETLSDSSESHTADELQSRVQAARPRHTAPAPGPGTEGDTGQVDRLSEGVRNGYAPVLEEEIPYHRPGGTEPSPICLQEPPQAAPRGQAGFGGWGWPWGPGQVHWEASSRAACCNVCGVCSGLCCPAGVTSGRWRACVAQAGPEGGCWHLVYHLQLRVQPWVSL